MQALQAAGRVCLLPGAQAQCRHILNLISVNLVQTDKKSECVSREETGYLFVDASESCRSSLRLVISGFGMHPLGSFLLLEVVSVGL